MVGSPGVARSLFGAQVAHGADDLPGERVLLARMQISIEDTGRAEVDQACAVLAVDQDVRGLEVTMHDAVAVGNAQGLRHRHKHVEASMRGHALFAAMLADVLAVHVLHDEVRRSVLQRAGRAQCHQRRMAQARKQAPLATEPGGRAATRACQVHELHRHKLVGLDLAAEVHDPDATATKFANRLVPRGQLQHRRRRRNVHARAVPRRTGILIGADQRNHQVQQVGVASAGILHEAWALLRRHVARAREDGPRPAQAVRARWIADLGDTQR